MNKKILFLSFSFLLACSKNQGEIGLLSATGILGLDSSVSLSKEEAALAADPSYLTLFSDVDLSAQSFNLLQWPITCADGKDSHGTICTGENAKELIGLRDLRLSGQIVIIDAEQMPWSALQGQRNIRSLKIEADKVIVRNSISLPGAALQITTDHLVFEAEGLIDLTPKSVVGRKPFPEGAKVAAVASPGLNGGDISINADKILVLGDKSKARVISKGGNGEDAAEGFGVKDVKGAVQVYAASKKTLDEESPTVLSREFIKLRSSIIYSARHFNPYLYGYGFYMCSGSYEWCADAYRSDEIPARGVDEWPADGQDGIAGGVPGLGGNGGLAKVWVKDIRDVSTQFVDVSMGADGNPDNNRLGSKGGLPNPAYKVVWKTRMQPGENRDIPELVRHEQKDGSLARSPITPKGKNAPGSFFLHNQSEVSKVFSKAYYDIKLKRIKQLYVDRKFAETVSLVNFVDGKFAAGNADADSNLAKAQLLKIKMSLIAQKDYFGRGLQDAPRFAFDFNLDQYEAQVKQAMAIYYLSSAFGKDFDSRGARAVMARQTLGVMESNINSSLNAIAETNKAITNLRWSVDLIQKEQAQFEQDLKTLEEDIRKEAEHNISLRNQQAQFAGFIKTLSALSQVIPVGQPALGEGFKLMAGFMSGGPKDTSIQGWIQYVSDMKGSYDGFNGKGKMLEAATSWDAFFGKFDKGNFVGKSNQEKIKYAQDLYEGLKPLQEKVTEAMQPMNQPNYGDKELQVEVENLRAASPYFKNITAKLENLFAMKKKFSADLVDVLEKVNSLNLQVNDYIAVSSRISESVLKDNWADDGVLKEVFKRKADEAREQLLFLYDQAAQSYSYVTLEDYKQPFNNYELLQKMEAVFLVKQDTDKAIVTLTDFYMTQIVSLKDAMRSKLRAVNPLLYMRQASNVFDLSPEQLVQLNSSGYVDVDLNESFYGDNSNVKIASIQAENNTNVFDSIEGGAVGPNPMIKLKFSLASEGSLTANGERHTFYYGDANSLFTWVNTYSFRVNGNTDFEINSLSSGLKGIIGGLVNDPDILRYSDVFTMHAGLTKLRIQSDNKRAPYTFRSLKVIVKYQFSDN